MIARGDAQRQPRDQVYKCADRCAEQMQSQSSDRRVRKRVTATIQRLEAVPDDRFKPKSESWRDMFDNIKLAAPDVVNKLKAKAKQTMASLSQ